MARAYLGAHTAAYTRSFSPSVGGDPFFSLVHHWQVGIMRSHGFLYSLYLSGLRTTSIKSSFTGLFTVCN